MRACVFGLILICFLPAISLAKSKAADKNDVLEIVYLPEKLSLKTLQVATTQDYQVFKYRRQNREIYVKMKPLDSRDPHEFVEWYLAPLDDSSARNLDTPEGERPYMVTKKVWKLKTVAQKSKTAKGKK